MKSNCLAGIAFAQGPFFEALFFLAVIGEVIMGIGERGKDNAVIFAHKKTHGLPWVFKFLWGGWTSRDQWGGCIPPEEWRVC